MTSGIIRNLSLSKKLSENVKENACPDSNQSGLLAIVDDNILVWSREDCCLYAQHIQQKDAVLQTLCVTRPPLWSVQRIAVNSRGTGVLLIGRRGVGVVDLPQRWGKNHTFDGGREHITCRIEYIAERFLVCHQRVAVVAAHWHPGSPNQNHVIVLATDHYLRVYSLRSRDVPEQALAITVPRPGNVFSRHYTASTDTGGDEGTTRPGKLGGSILGEEAVDFTIAAPVLPNNDASAKVPRDVGGGEDNASSAAVAADLLWPVFVLYANGDVYHTRVTLHPHKLRSRTVTGPLLLQPPREDNYALEWSSIAWVGEAAGGVLVLGTCGGRMHHCVVLPPKPPKQEQREGESSEVALVQQELSEMSVSSASNPSVSLYVYESVDLELSLCPDDGSVLSPLLLYTDHTAHNRYLVLHSAGVHAVTVTLVDSLRRFALADEGTSLPDSAGDGLECECSVEHLVCTRALQSAALLPVTGGALWTPALSAHSGRQTTTGELLVLLASGALLSVRLPPAVAALPLLEHLDGNTASSSSDTEHQCFESLIRGVLQRGASQPLLACSGGAALDPVEALDLTNRMLHTLRTQYIAPQATAQHHILHRVRVLCDQQRSLCSQLNSLQQQRQQLEQQTQSLQQQQEEAKRRQEDITQRLDNVVSSALRRMPGLSGGERWLLKQLQSIQEQVPHLHDDIQHLHTKLHWHSNNVQASSSEETAAQATDLKLSQNQLHSLKKSIGAESEKIEKLVSKFNSLKKSLEP